MKEVNGTKRFNLSFIAKVFNNITRYVPHRNKYTCQREQFIYCITCFVIVLKLIKF